MMDESNNYYVSSRGLMKACDYRSSTPVSSIHRLIHYPVEGFARLRQKMNPTIYVCSSAIADFCERLLPSIDFEFTLVSGDCDELVPYDVFPCSASLHRLLNSPYLRHWFCQNIMIAHPKITLMPIGLDYHTMTEANDWGCPMSPHEQEQCLLGIRALAVPFWQRELRCYANFHFLMTTRHGYDRVAATRQIPKDLVDYEPVRIPRLQSWQRQSRYAFVVSPHGNGLDCHRTWEALAMGCIPIVKRSSLDRLYDGLPVLIVSAWSDLNERLLQTTAMTFRRRSVCVEKLSLRYWTDRMQR